LEKKLQEVIRILHFLNNDPYTSYITIYLIIHNVYADTMRDVEGQDN
jgi:hypothetical protein